jgi:hypothetical protein
MLQKQVAATSGWQKTLQDSRESGRELPAESYEAKRLKEGVQDQISSKAWPY